MALLKTDTKIFTRIYDFLAWLGLPSDYEAVKLLPVEPRTEFPGRAYDWISCKLRESPKKIATWHIEERTCQTDKLIVTEVIE